ALLRAPEDVADANQGRSLLHRDAVVLTGAHRELPQAVRLRQLTKAAEVRTRSLRVTGEGRHRHQPADVAVQRQEGTQVLRRHPGLRRLSGKVDLDERG